MLGARALLPAAAGFGLPSVRSSDEYPFCRRLALALEEDASRFRDELFPL